MAGLVLNVQKDSISSDCTTLAFSDHTGNYNGVTNPGGYGAPNEIRANLYMLALVNLVASTGREPIAIVPNTGNPNTVASWTATLNQDGWYEIYMFACYPYDSGTTYGLGWISYDAGSNAFYKSLQAANIGNSVADPAWWIATTDVEDFIAAVALDQPNTYESVDDDVEVCRSGKCLAYQTVKTAKAIRSGEKCDSAMSLVRQIRTFYESAQENAALGNYSDARADIEYMQLLCSDCGFGHSSDCGCGCH